MAKLDDDVRARAKALKEAISAANAGGFRVSWPHRFDDLDKIAISETKAATAADASKAPAAPQPAAAQPAPAAATAKA